MTSRRDFMAYLAAAATASPLAARAQPAGSPFRIDVHHHTHPPQFVARAHDLLAKHVTVFEAALAWTPQQSLEQMDKTGVATAMLSVPTPWDWFERDEARHLVRLCNDYVAEQARDHPGRFGVFACLPMPDVDGALAEITYAFDTLNADGIVLTTDYGDKWPGDPSLAPVFDELNRRKAAVFFHPTNPNCCSGLMPWIPDAVLEFLFDSTRAITSMLFTGTFTRTRDARYIFCHAGGTFPMLADRIFSNAKRRKEIAERLPDGPEAEVKRLHFDITSSVSRPTLDAALALMPTSQLLLGTDCPILPMALTIDDLGRFGLDPGVLRAIERENALALFPRLRL